MRCLRERERLIEAMLREQTALQHLRGSSIPLRPIPQRATSHLLGEQHIARIAGLTRSRQIQSAQSREIARTRGIATSTIGEVLDVELSHLILVVRGR